MDRPRVLSRNPPIYLLPNFVSDLESAHLIEAAGPLFHRSEVHGADGSRIDDARTSESASLPDDAITTAIQQRALKIAALQKPEALQVVRYGVGQEYKPHFDPFDRALPADQKVICSSGGRRAVTILVYLNEVPSGGETIFPELGLTIAPIKNAGLFWRNLNPDGSIDKRTQHGGAPVGSGVKYALNVWLLEPEPAIDCTRISAGISGKMPAPWRVVA